MDGEVSYYILAVFAGRSSLPSTQAVLNTVHDHLAYGMFKEINGLFDKLLNENREPLLLDESNPTPRQYGWVEVYGVGPYTLSYNDKADVALLTQIIPKGDPYATQSSPSQS